MLYNNFFLPSHKLVLKEREGETIKRRHDRASAPYLRLMLDPDVDEPDKKALKLVFLSLDLVQIQKDMDKMLSKIMSLSLGY